MTVEPFTSPGPSPVKPERVVVAMSGGVDSSVAALILAREGIPAIGVSMQVWDYRQNGGCASKATCCAPSDFQDARRAANIAGIPYYVFDLEKSFRGEVIDKFVASYRQGVTPNPCIDCNNRVKFRELRNRAHAIGCSHVATGHYARIEQDAQGVFRLLRGRDSAKDQSYFLYGLTQQDLATTLFPVGDMEKGGVRQIAAEAGLPTASKPESQDICFVSGDLQDFLVRIGGQRSGGFVVSLDGKVLARHEGISRFTVGQRRGLNIGGTGKPLYVLHIDPETERVTVGEREELEREDFCVEELSWVQPAVATQVLSRGEPTRAVVQVRHRHQGVEVELCPAASGGIECRFLEGWTPVAPGQAAVFYDTDNEEVLGGGRIVNSPLSAIRRQREARAYVAS